MTDKRKLELFDNVINWITEVVNKTDAIYTLGNLGFTSEEIKFIYDEED